MQKVKRKWFRNTLLDVLVGKPQDELPSLGTEGRDQVNVKLQHNWDPIEPTVQLPQECMTLNEITQTKNLETTKHVSFYSVC